MIANSVKEAFSTFFANIDVAIIILLTSFVVGKLVNILLRKVFLEIQLDKTINFFADVNLQLSKAISDTVSTLIYSAGIIWSLSILRLLGYIIDFLGLIIFIAVFGSILLSMRDFLPNLVSGFWVRKKVDEGDTIRLNGLKGEVVSVELLNLVVNDSGDRIIIPYSVFSEKTLSILK